MAKKKESWDSEVSNDMTYLMYYNRLRDYCLNMFEWSGLPDTINKRFLELTMFNQGSVVFFDHPTLGLTVSQVMAGGVVNHYHEPTHYEAIMLNESNVSLTPDNSVIMWNNYAREPLTPIVRSYAYRLYRVEKTLDVNINSQKFPVLILADEQQRMTLYNAYQQYDGNEPFIFGNKSGFDKDAFQVLNTGAPFVGDKLMEYKHNLWNEAMTFLGVGNSKQDKKERLVSDEVQANDEQIKLMRENLLQTRQEACEAINNMFGLNVWVEFKLDKENEEETNVLNETGDNE